MSSDRMPSGANSRRTGDHFLNLFAWSGVYPLQLLVREEVDVVGAVDRLRDSVDFVGDCSRRRRADREGQR